MWRRAFLVAGGLVALGLCFGCGLLAGLIAGSVQANQRRYHEEKEAIGPILAADPAFAGVELRPLSDGGIYLTGEVPAAADLERLENQVVRAVGEPRSRRVLAVSVWRFTGSPQSTPIPRP